MNKSQFQYLLVFGLAVLLGTLAFLQYKWLSEISTAEKERLQKRLEIDAQHFAEDFNRLIQITYYNFQVDDSNWQAKIPERYQTWRNNSAYPEQIKELSLIFENGDSLKFDLTKQQFLRNEADQSFLEIQRNFQPVDEVNFTLTMPIYRTENQLIDFNPPGVKINPLLPSRMNMPEVAGYLIIELDQEIVKNKILNDLSDKHFPDGDYRFAVSSNSRKSNIFQTESIEKADVSVPMLNLMNENFAFFVNKDLASTINLSNARSNGIFLNQRFESRVTTSQNSNTNSSVKIQVLSGNPQTFERQMMSKSGLWTLQVQHRDGSLEQFVGNTKRNNLFISFGILGLLGASVGLIFLSAHRAQVLAQRQMDFVSAVSHEFRTPLAVIYSAGENLADGVAREETQVSRYGNLIKGEGKKLTAMVEQILEFAGARSGNKKYYLVETEPKSFIEDALAECQPLLDENNFTVETEVEENLPVIIADENAMSHTIQNLIVNAVKYSNGTRWIKISASREAEQIKITVEDNGIGIAKKDLKQIFSPFYRAKDVVDAQIRGNGLGLSLVKQTIEAHGGTIEVESEIGKGSRFVITIPLEKTGR